MSTNNLRDVLLAEQAKRQAAMAARHVAMQRRKRNAELRSFLAGGSLVVTGLLLAVVCNLIAG